MKSVRILFWILIGVTLSVSFVGCGKKDASSNNEFASQCPYGQCFVPSGYGGSGSYQGYSVSTDQSGLWVDAMGKSVRGNIVVKSAVYPNGIIIVFTASQGSNPNPYFFYGYSPSPQSPRAVMEIRDFVREGGYYSYRVSGVVTLCREYLEFIPGSSGCSMTTVGFNTVMQENNLGNLVASGPLAQQ